MLRLIDSKDLRCGFLQPRCIKMPHMQMQRPADAVTAGATRNQHCASVSAHFNVALLKHL